MIIEKSYQRSFNCGVFFHQSAQEVELQGGALIGGHALDGRNALVAEMGTKFD